MIASIVRVSDKYLHSASFSLQQEHIELYARGALCEISLFDKSNNFIAKYDKTELARVVGMAIKNGRRQAENQFTGATEFYYLAPR